MHFDYAAGSPGWIAHLERAHGLVNAVARRLEEAEPSVHLAPAARHLERGLSALYDAFDGRADRATAIGRAHARFWDAAIEVARAGLPSAVDVLREVCAELIAAEEEFPRVPPAARAPVKLRAGADLPPLHTIERASLVPRFRVPAMPAVVAEAPVAELPEPTTFDELMQAALAMRQIAADRTKAALARSGARSQAEAEQPAKELEAVPVGFAFVPPAALEEDDFVRRWARVCFEEIGMLGVQRAPLPGEDWRACLALELRMVAAIDALAALGPVAIAHVEPMAMDAPAPDPMGMFAVAMIGGCLEGRDALACAERVLHRFGPADPVIADAFVSAMKLAPNPLVPLVMRSLCASSDHACRAIGVEVLAAREWLTEDELDALVEEEDPRVFALALPALGAARHPGLERAIERGLAHDDPRVRDATLDAMTFAIHPRTAAAAREMACKDDGDGALVRLAIVGDEAEWRWLLQRMEASPTPAAVEAVGWAGLVESVPSLLRLLEAAEAAVVEAAANALERMLGAGLKETRQVMPEALEEAEPLDPDPEPRPARRTLAEMVSDARDRPQAGSSEGVEVVSTDPARWRAYWAEHGAKYERGMRIRRGQGYSPSVSLFEVDRLGLSGVERERLHRELAWRTAGGGAFESGGFVVRQEAALKWWEGRAARGDSRNVSR